MSNQSAMIYYVTEEVHPFPSYDYIYIPSSVLTFTVQLSISLPGSRVPHFKAFYKGCKRTELSLALCSRHKNTFLGTVAS